MSEEQGWTISNTTPPIVNEWLLENIEQLREHCLIASCQHDALITSNYLAKLSPPGTRRYLCTHCLGMVDIPESVLDMMRTRTAPQEAAPAPLNVKCAVCGRTYFLGTPGWLEHHTASRGSFAFCSQAHFEQWKAQGNP